MISVEEALSLLYWHDTFAGISRGVNSKRMMSNSQAEQIAKLIKHLASKCDLEVNELQEEKQCQRLID